VFSKIATTRHKYGVERSGDPASVLIRSPWLFNGRRAAFFNAPAKLIFGRHAMRAAASNRDA
jgi:hypothetical protein